MGFVNNLECLLVCNVLFLQTYVYLTNLMYLRPISPFQGSCSIEKQTVFLSLLTIYLKTVHLENNDKENSNQLLKVICTIY